MKDPLFTRGTSIVHSFWTKKSDSLVSVLEFLRNLDYGVSQEGQFCFDIHELSSIMFSSLLTYLLT